MKIEKLKKAGKSFYPATITNAIKDPNFSKVDGSVMTQGEINQQLSDTIADNKLTSDIALNALDTKIDTMFQQMQLSLKALGNFIEVEEPGFYVVDKNLNIGFAAEQPEGYLNLTNK